MEGSDRDLVPFLTVLKGDEVIDTICLEGQDLIVMGRHNTCDLVVGHASSSRQHVEIQLVYGTREIVLTDLCSVHGTWVEGKRLTSMAPTTVRNSVTFQIAASKRVYRIEWRPSPVAEQRSGSAVSSAESSLQTSSHENDQDSSSLNFSGTALSGLRFTYDNEDYRPSAPFPSVSDNVIFPQDDSISPAIRACPVKPSPRKLPDMRKSLSSPKVFYEQDENISPGLRKSPTRSSSLTKSVNSPKPMRRLAFSNRQTNVPSPPRSPSVKKPLAERTGSSGSLKPPSSPNIPLNKPKVSVHEVATPSKLWLRRCSSAPLPALTTAAEVNCPQAPKLASLRETRGESAEPSASGSCDGDYPSDKENVNPVVSLSKGALISDRVQDIRGGSTSKDSSFVESIVREPFRPLHYTALDVMPVHHQLQSNASSEEEYGSKVLGLPRFHHRRTVAAQNLEHMLRKLKLSESMEGRRQWYLVVDTNCLLDDLSLKALKQLEGIRETCVIIPKIVVRELDGLKKRHGQRTAARIALRWIESSMVKLPSWIHVQSTSETRPVGPTPPVSPAAFPHFGDLMSPTNDDHILECALTFDMVVRRGRVALLTGDTALKIKAMAEGLVSEGAHEFCESLLSPYSNRFLWAGSTAHGKTWVDRSNENSPTVTGEFRSRSHLSHVRHSLEDLRHHVDAQPRGLKMIVAR